MYNKINDAEKKILFEISKKLQIHPFIVYILINFESGWNPNAKNPVSSARGLIQIINESAIQLGYKSSLDAINRNNTTILQLENIVYPYLKKFMPYPSAQSLFMAVFYPRYRYVHPDTIFPIDVQKYNPGVISPRTYIEKMFKAIGISGLPIEIVTPLYNIANSFNLNTTIFLSIAFLIFYYYFK